MVRNKIDGMDTWTAEDLSPEETELIIDFVEWAGEFDRQLLENQTIDGDLDAIGFREAFEHLLPHISEDATEFDSQIFQLFRLRGEIKSHPVFEYEHADELPSDPVVTPGELNKFTMKEEIADFLRLLDS